MIFSPGKHPRDTRGRWREVLGGLKRGNSAELPDGTKVTKTKDNKFRVTSENDVTTEHTDVGSAADHSLTLSAKNNHAQSLGGSKRHENLSAALGANRRMARSQRRRDQAKSNADQRQKRPATDDAANAARKKRRPIGTAKAGVGGAPRSPDAETAHKALAIHANSDVHLTRGEHMALLHAQQGKSKNGKITLMTKSGGQREYDIHAIHSKLQSPSETTTRDAVTPGGTGDQQAKVNQTKRRIRRAKDGDTVGIGGGVKIAKTSGPINSESGKRAGVYTVHKNGKQVHKGNSATLAARVAHKHAANGKTQSKDEISVSGGELAQVTPKGTKLYKTKEYRLDSVPQKQLNEESNNGVKLAGEYMDRLGSMKDGKTLKFNHGISVTRKGDSFTLSYTLKGKQKTVHAQGANVDQKISDMVDLVQKREGDIMHEKGMRPPMDGNPRGRREPMAHEMPGILPNLMQKPGAKGRTRKDVTGGISSHEKAATRVASGKTLKGKARNIVQGDTITHKGEDHKVKSVDKSGSKVKVTTHDGQTLTFNHDAPISRKSKVTGPTKSKIGKNGTTIADLNGMSDSELNAHIANVKNEGAKSRAIRVRKARQNQKAKESQAAGAKAKAKQNGKFDVAPGETKTFQGEDARQFAHVIRGGSNDKTTQQIAEHYASAPAGVMAKRDKREANTDAAGINLGSLQVSPLPAHTHQAEPEHLENNDTLAHRVTELKPGEGLDMGNGTTVRKNFGTADIYSGKRRVYADAAPEHVGVFMERGGHHPLRDSKGNPKPAMGGATPADHLPDAQKQAVSEAGTYLGMNRRRAVVRGKDGLLHEVDAKGRAFHASTTSHYSFGERQKGADEASLAEGMLSGDHPTRAAAEAELLHRHEAVNTAKIRKEIGADTADKRGPRSNPSGNANTATKSKTQPFDPRTESKAALVDRAGQLPVDGTLEFPDGIRIARRPNPGGQEAIDAGAAPDLLFVESASGDGTPVESPEAAATVALARSARSTHQESLGGPQRFTKVREARKVHQ